MCDFSASLSGKDSASHHSDTPQCYCSLFTNEWLNKGYILTSMEKYGSFVSLLILSCKKYLQKRCFVHISVVLFMLLILAGDVETNPGPGEL